MNTNYTILFHIFKYVITGSLTTLLCSINSFFYNCYEKNSLVQIPNRIKTIKIVLDLVKGLFINFRLLSNLKPPFMNSYVKLNKVKLILHRRFLKRTRDYMLLCFDEEDKTLELVQLESRHNKTIKILSYFM